MHLCLGCIDDLWVVGCCALVCAAGALLLRSVGGLYQLQTGGRAHGESDEYLLNYWDPYIPNSWMLYTGKSIYINGWFGGTRILSYSRYSRKPPYIAIWYIYIRTHTLIYQAADGNWHGNYMFWRILMLHFSSRMAHDQFFVAVFFTAPGFPSPPAEVICVYGYSLTPLIPMSVICLVPP